MPTLRINDADIYFEESGKGDETIVFSHGLLWDSRQWRAQVDAFSDRYRCIAYDHRGQGQSSVPQAPLVDMETLYTDAVALIEALDAGPCHFVGLSMGGFVGLRLASRRPDLVRSLALLNTAADPEPAEHVPEYRKLCWVARIFGVQVVADRVMPILFGPTYLNDPSRAKERAMWKERLMDNARSIYKAVYGVIYRPGLEHEAARIGRPALVILGAEDQAIAAWRSERLHQLIEGSKLVRIPECGHTASVECPEAVNTALQKFLAQR